MRWVFLFVMLGVAFAQSQVKISSGIIQGGVNQEAKVGYFLGIPYAQAERWKAPKPVQVWSGVRPTTQVGNACPQRDSLASRLGGYLPPRAEDCLTLNVWKPLGEAPAEGWPVMVWIHGGSFTSGASGEGVYDGTALAAKGVVLISINYRLGVFGYLALPALQAEDPNKSTGNYGTLDQLLALRWVQENAKVFGGDASNVTLFGQSAGGMSVCTLMASPLAKGLFHKAVIQSGGCEYIRTLDQGFKFGDELTRLLGCTPTDLNCLRALPAEAFFPPEGSEQNAKLAKIIPDAFAQRPYKPHIDKYVLDKVPLVALKQGYAAGIPLIAGATTQEAWAERSNVNNWEEFAQKVKEYLPNRVEAVVQDYKRRFSNAGDAWAILVSDFVLFCPSLDAAKAQQAFAPTYTYIFDYRSEVPFLWDMGSFHGVDVPWTFGTLRVWPSLAFYFAPDIYNRANQFAERLQAYLIRFAQSDAPKGWPQWREYPTGEVMYFNSRLGLRADPYRERCGVLR